MYYPPIEDLKHVSGTYPGIPLVPLYCDLLADLETPVSAYYKVSQGPFSFLLESVLAGERLSRYSYIGISPHLVITQRGDQAIVRRIPRHEGEREITEQFHCTDPLELIQAEMDRYQLLDLAQSYYEKMPDFYGGAVGYLSYEAGASFEGLPVPVHDELDLPLAIFCFTETVLVFDHVKHRIRVITHLHLDATDLEAEYQRGITRLEDVRHKLRQELHLPVESDEPVSAELVSITANCTREQYEEKVRRAQEYIKSGDIFQVVPSLRLSRPITTAPLTVYRALRSINPSPYMFYLDLDDFQLVGTSPELLIRVDQGEVTIRPIAGTRPRGTSFKSDQQLAEDLKADSKERAEHVMLVDLGRNDVGRVSRKGSVSVTEFMTIEHYSHVMHLVSNVAGQLQDGIPLSAVLRAGFPAGTVSGAPKIRAMEIISELEGTQRGAYAGAVGYFSHTGNMDTAIALRTIVLKNGRAYVQAGAGVVADSDPSAEYQECMNKARALLSALEVAEEMARLQREQGILAREV